MYHCSALMFLILVLMSMMTGAYSTEIHFNRQSDAKSCLEHLRNGAQEDGLYRVLNADHRAFTVYCDFSSEPGAAWTLVESWRMQNQDLKEIQQKSLKQDSPVMEHTPNKNLFRFSLHHMTSLRRVSTHWRATCSLHSYSMDYQDYMLGNFHDFDIINFEGMGQCKKVDYVNIRGHKAMKTQVRVWQGVNKEHLHVESAADGCLFNAKSGSVVSEDNFGYHGHTNPKFRCTQSPSSITQWWFGGYL